MSEVVLHSKLRELGDELRLEREVRFRQEKELTHHRFDIDDLDVQLQEFKEARDRELDLNRKLRQEYADLKQKYDLLYNENEESNLIYKRRNQEQISELTAHVEALTKSKSKYEKDNKQFLLEIENLRVELDSLVRSKAQAIALCKELENRESEHLIRISEITRQLTESNEVKNRLLSEKSEIVRRTEILEFELQQFSLNFKRVSTELDDARLHLENEILFRSNIEIKLKNVQLDLHSANSRVEEANEEIEDLKKQVSIARDDVKAIRERTDKELNAKNEELEDVKRKLTSKYVEVQEQLTEALSKASNLEKQRQRLQVQIDVLIVDLDGAKRRAEDAIRHEKQLELDVAELRNKLNASEAELEASLQANRNYAVELAKFKSLNEQLVEQIDILNKEKRRFIEEIESLNVHITEINIRLVDSERRIKIIDAERQSVQLELDDTRDALQAEIIKYQNLQVQYESYKASTDKRLLEKDEEIDALRQTHRRQIETLQENFDAMENRYKNEIINIKKKYQIEIEEIIIKYEAAKRARDEAENVAKKLQQINRELNDKYIEEQHLHDATREQLNAAEKRNQTLRGELEEIKTLYERSEKVRKVLEIEVQDYEQKLSESQVSLNRALAERKKFETDYLEIYESVHEIKVQMKNAEERARNASALVVKKDEEIRHEHELLVEIEASRKALDQQLREAQARAEESEEYARKEARRVSAKFEARLAHVESELDLERGKNQELLKEIRRLEKRSKELVIQIEDEQAKVLSLTDSHDKLQDKMKKYRGQIEGAEGQIAMNLTKCRRLQRELEDAEERAETMTRTFLRSGSQAAAETSEEYQSDAIQEYSNNVSGGNKSSTTTYLRATYSLSKPTHIDDYTLNYSKPSLSWRSTSRYRTVDLDDEDRATPARTNRYSSYLSSSSNTAQQYHNNYQSDYNRRAREPSKSRFSTKLRRIVRGLSV